MIYKAHQYKIWLQNLNLPPEEISELQEECDFRFNKLRIKFNGILMSLLGFLVQKYICQIDDCDCPSIDDEHELFPTNEYCMGFLDPFESFILPDTLNNDFLNQFNSCCECSSILMNAFNDAINESKHEHSMYILFNYPVITKDLSFDAKEHIKTELRAKEFLDQMGWIVKGFNG
jgi:hypothetical protein